MKSSLHKSESIQGNQESYLSKGEQLQVFYSTQEFPIAVRLKTNVFIALLCP